jgi:rhodanese-related sulfurtransferase
MLQRGDLRQSERLGADQEAVMRGWVKVLVIMILLSVLLAGVVFSIAGRPLAFQILQRRIEGKFPQVQWISTEELARWRDDPSRPQPVVLDARTQPEFELSHLRGALPIDPYRPSLKSVQEFAKDTPLVVYSSAGYRSARVASWLEKSGYSNVRNLTGSIFLWANEGRPLFREENRPTALVHPYDRKWGLLVERPYRAQAPDLERRSAAP